MSHHPGCPCNQSNYATCQCAAIDQRVHTEALNAHTEAMKFNEAEQSTIAQLRSDLKAQKQLANAALSDLQSCQQDAEAALARCVELAAGYDMMKETAANYSSDLADLRGLVVKKDEALESIKEYWNGNVGSSVDAANVHQERAEEALLLTSESLRDQVCVPRGEWAALKKDRDDWRGSREYMNQVEMDLCQLLDGDLSKDGTRIVFDKAHKVMTDNTSLRARVAQLEGDLTTIADAIDEDDTGLTLRQVQKWARKALAATTTEGRG